ncbi:MAG: aldose 1-epimerase family protein [Flavisolibacter sp.]
MAVIENDTLKVVIDKRGAEIKSILHKREGIEYMWGGDPAFWSKTSPVLFPVVGALKGNSYKYNDKSYHLPRHGFAREKEFKIQEQKSGSIIFYIESDVQTMEVYPFDFRLFIAYNLVGNALSVTYRVGNRGGGIMLFSLGGHPAFKIPLVENTAYEDYRLRFEKIETVQRWLVSQEGLIEKKSEPLLDQSQFLDLKKQLFIKDAIVIKKLKSIWVQLESNKTSHGLKFIFKGFPFLGLWAAPGADFLCIEPWCGIADSVDTDQQLGHKEGILQLPAGQQFEVTWEVQCY